MALFTGKGDCGTTKTFGCDLPAPRPDTFFVYAILCDDNSIYIGQTDNLKNRWNQHLTGVGALYFKSHKPMKIIHYEDFLNRAEAVKREQDLKTGFGRKWLKREWEAGRTRQAGQRVSKSSTIAEALGTLDEINSFLGICKEKSRLHSLAGATAGKARSGLAVPPNNMSVHELVHQTQQNLFIVQAELAGADKHITRDKVTETETTINEIEKLLPPITTFFISGGTELAAHFDFARTLARRAERRVVAVQEEGIRAIADDTRAYLNRLSSLLYALARLTNHMSGITEEPPQYK